MPLFYKNSPEMLLIKYKNQFVCHENIFNMVPTDLGLKIIIMKE